MLKVKTRYQPHIRNINKKYYPVINKIIAFSNTLSFPLNCNIYGVYIRGSVALGCETKNSDLDIVVLLSNSQLNNTLRFNDTLDALLALYEFPYRVDTKVFNVGDTHIVEPPITGRLKEIALKHLNFDISANGICFYGKEIKNQLNIFESYEDFIMNNKLVRGTLIKELVHNMVNNEFFNDYYRLVKECIRLSAYIHFKADSLYSSIIDDCFTVAMKANFEINSELKFMFDFIRGPIKQKIDDIEMLKKCIIKVSEFILS